MWVLPSEVAPFSWERRPLFGLMYLVLSQFLGSCFTHYWRSSHLPGGYSGSLSQYDVCPTRRLAVCGRIGASESPDQRNDLSDSLRLKSCPGIGPAFHQRTSRWVRARRSSHDSRDLRHQRGSKIAVENRNSLRKLRDKEVDRAWKSHKTNCM